MATRYDDIINQGADYFLSLEYADDDDSPVDLTGYTARMQIRRTYDDPSTLFEIETPDDNLVLGENGTIDLHMSAETTAGLPAGRWPYDMELVDPDGIVTRLIEGHMTVRPEVTR